MAIALEQVAETLQVSPEESLAAELGCLCGARERLAQLDIADFQDRYGVTSIAELRQKIESGATYSHPAWEDLIEWENLASHVQRSRPACATMP